MKELELGTYAAEKYFWWPQESPVQSQIRNSILQIHGSGSEKSISGPETYWLKS